jgi:hypothetical protein
MYCAKLSPEELKELERLEDAQKLHSEGAVGIA